MPVADPDSKGVRGVEMVVKRRLDGGAAGLNSDVTVFLEKGLSAGKSCADFMFQV